MYADDTLWKPCPDAYQRLTTGPAQCSTPYCSQRRHDRERAARGGAARSIVIDEDNTILAGNATVEAAAQAGVERIQVVEADGETIIAVRRRGLTPEQKARLAVFDNRTAELAEWDTDVLRALADDGTDLSSFWFPDELDALLSDEQAPPTGGQTDPDDVPEVPSTAVTKPNDLWVLGEHRLLCADATRPETLARVLAGADADLVWTDPPYGVDYVGKTRDALTIANDAMAPETFEPFLRAAFDALLSHTKPGGAIYVCHADLRGLEFRRAFQDAGWLLKQCLIWVKQSFVMGRQDYQWRHEPILYGWKPGAAHYFVDDRTQSTVWEVDRPTRNTEHPTMKPVDLVGIALHNSSQPGDLVVDSFGGSGSTLIAAEQTGRRSALVELNPRFCDVIIERWEAFTGGTAQRVSEGTA